MVNTYPTLSCDLNGEFTKPPNAKISVTDCGFTYDDVAYEAESTYGRQLIRLAQDIPVLEGIRSGLIEKNWTAQDITDEPRPISRAEVASADQKRLSSATKAVLLVSLNGSQPICSNQPGDLPPTAFRLPAGHDENPHPCRSLKLTNIFYQPPTMHPKDISPADSLITYPCNFPIKVMGKNIDGLVHALTHIAHQFDPTFDASTIELRESKGGNYLGVTLTVKVINREQLDELYRTLSTHPMVKVVL